MVDCPHFDGVHILSRVLTSNYLLKHVRERGGAYGVAASHGNGVKVFSSYDDPHVKETIEQFCEGCAWLRRGEYGQKDIDEARLSLFGEVDAPLEPQNLGFGDVMTGKTAEQRQAQRDALLDLTATELDEVAQKAYVCERQEIRASVFGTREKAKEVEKDPEWVVEEVKLEWSVCNKQDRSQLDCNYFKILAISR